MACDLFGFPDSALIGKQLSELLKVKKKHQETLQELEVDPETGNVIQISGKIVSPSS